MRRGLIWLILLAGGLRAQDLVVNYLGGVRPTVVGFDARITDAAAIGVSPDGRLLYVTQAARRLVLRYDLRARTVDAIPVPGLAESVSTIAVNDDGTALVPLGAQVARLELDGKITTPGIPFAPRGPTLHPLLLKAVAHPGSGPGRNAIIGIYGDRAIEGLFFLVVTVASGTSGNTSSLGIVDALGCFASNCSNASLPPNSPARSYRAQQIWGLAMGSVAGPTGGTQHLAYFTDPNSPVGFFSGIVGVIRQDQTVTILGHPGLAAIPMGTIGARLWKPTGIVLDSGGNLLVADTGNHRILRRTPAGVWSVFAGTGVRGARGDGGPALNAELFEPRSLALDTQGVLYIHDSGNGLLRRILPSGVIERIGDEAGEGGETETLIQDLPLPNVTAMTTDAQGQLYIATQARIVRVDPRGRASYIVGTGQSGRSNDGVRASEAPIEQTRGLAVDPQGRLIWSENFRMRRLEPSGLAYTIAGRGVQADVNRGAYDADPVPALQAYLQPTALSTAVDGSLLIAHGTWLRRLRDGQITSVTGLPWCDAYADGIPAIFACTAQRGAGLLALPDGRIAYDGATGGAVRVIDQEGFVNTWARLPGYQIQSMAPGPNGSLYALLYRFSTTGTQTYYLLARISATGQVTWLSSDTRTAQLAALRPGQPIGRWPFIDGSPMVSDNRGLLYMWDSITRRILVIGEVSSVMVDTEPSGQRVLVDGNPVVTPQVFRWLPGEYHSAEAAATADGAGFTAWTHGTGRQVTWLPPGGPSRVVGRFASSAAP